MIGGFINIRDITAEELFLTSAGLAELQWFDLCTFHSDVVTSGGQ
jgi:hypothetical protein